VTCRRFDQSSTSESVGVTAQTADRSRDSMYTSTARECLQRYELAAIMVLSVAQLAARWTNNRKVVGSRPANAVCFTVDR